MILWCKQCGAYIGLIEPLDDWGLNRQAICMPCATKIREFGTEMVAAIIRDQHRDEETKTTE